MAGGRFPSAPRRVALVGLENLAPYLYQMLKSHSHTRSATETRQWQRAVWQALDRVLSRSDGVFLRLDKLHLALFYIFGSHAGAGRSAHAE